MKPILLVHCCVDGDDWSPAYIDRMPGWPVEVFYASWGHDAPSLDAYAGIVITGSAASPNDPPDWVEAVEVLLREAAERDLPTLGICFGHQIIARALLGPEATGDAPQPEIGYLPVTITAPDDPIWRGFDNPFHTFVSHQDEVRPHPGLQILAVSDGCAVQGLRIPGKRMWGVQFHLEMSKKEMHKTLTYRSAKHPELGIDAEATFARIDDLDPLARRLFANFLEHVEGGDGD